MNWVRLLVVMIAMVGCPAVSTVLHNDRSVEVQSVYLQDIIVDVSGLDSVQCTDDIDDDFDGYLPPVSSISEAHLFRASFRYQSRNNHTYRSHHGIRAPPLVS